MNWNNVTLEKYLKIQDVLNEEVLDEEQKAFEIANIIYEQDITELPLPEYVQKMKALSFVNQLPEKDKLANSYTINDTKYKTSANIESIQANQFIDFQNYGKNKDMIGCISCFFIPDGHKYNDGYDMIKVKEDIKQLPITVANSLSFFFKSQLTVLLVLFQRSSYKKMKQMGMSKEKLKEMEESLTTLGMSHLLTTLGMPNLA